MNTKMTFELPTDLHAELKVVAARQHTSVKALLVNCAKEIVASQQQPDRLTDPRAEYREKG